MLKVKCAVIKLTCLLSYAGYLVVLLQVFIETGLRLRPELVRLFIEILDSAISYRLEIYRPKLAKDFELVSEIPVHHVLTGFMLFRITKTGMHTSASTRDVEEPNFLSLSRSALGKFYNWMCLRYILEVLSGRCLPTPSAISTYCSGADLTSVHNYCITTCLFADFGSPCEGNQCQPPSGTGHSQVLCRLRPGHFKVCPAVPSR